MSKNTRYIAEVQRTLTYFLHKVYHVTPPYPVLELVKEVRRPGWLWFTKQAGYIVKATYGGHSKELRLVRRKYGAYYTAEGLASTVLGWVRRVDDALAAEERDGSDH